MRLHAVQLLVVVVARLLSAVVRLVRAGSNERAVLITGHHVLMVIVAVLDLGLLVRANVQLNGELARGRSLLPVQIRQIGRAILLEVHVHLLSRRTSSLQYHHLDLFGSEAVVRVSLLLS